MSLTASLYIGQSALAASQLALQVTGNNLANAATPGYHRQRVDMTAVQGQQVGPRQHAGRGVGVAEIRRIIDPALQARVRDAAAAEGAAQVRQSILDQIESVTTASPGAEGSDVSGLMTRLFNSFSELANNPATPTARAAVVEQGAALAGQLQDVRRQLIGQRDQADAQLGDAVRQADGLLDQIAALNGAITTAEGGQGGLNGNGNLRDQRDRLLSDLGELMDITVLDKGNGSVDVLVNSTPLILGTTVRPIEFQLRSDGVAASAGGGELSAGVYAIDQNEKLTITGGRIGGLLAERTASIDRTVDDLDRLTTSLIFEVNRLHAQGRPSNVVRDTTGTLQTATADQPRAFNDPNNSTILNNDFAKLALGPKNGSFQVRITDANGNVSTTRIDIDLDGLTNAGVPGTSDDTSLSNLRTALDAIPNLSAQITPAGELRLSTDAGYDVSFADDSSGILAVLGVNGFFTGTSGEDIAVRADLRNDASKLAIGSAPGKNETALAIAGLRTAKLNSLSGQTLQDLWAGATGRNAVGLQAANASIESLATVRQSLESQEAALSGVSTDEESINLITYQQQYQGAAKFINVVNEMTQVLLGLV
ncbi:MAG: flagellar hook-associated protein FlgK [Phycisphaerales bacterium]